VRVVAGHQLQPRNWSEGRRFREDLFYRLNVIRLQIPPLARRRDEIPSLVNYFVLRASEEFRKGQLRFAEETMEHLLLCTVARKHPAAAQRDPSHGAALAEPNAVSRRPRCPTKS